MLSAGAHRTGGSLLGHGSGLLLVTLGLIILCVLFWATGGHRARLAAEALGVLLGGGLTIVVVGSSRPSAQVVTRAYVSLSRHTRALLIAGICMVFGFAVITATIEPAIPRLREIPAFGGLVTLDWVLSLTVLAIAGATLLLLGIVAVGAHPTNAVQQSAATGDFVLERLSYASNARGEERLRACFTPDEAGTQAFRQWRALLAEAAPLQVLLVHSTTVWGRLWSEWHLRGGGVTQRWILVAHETGGRIASADLFQHVVGANLHVASDHRLSHTQG